MSDPHSAVLESPGMQELMTAMDSGIVTAPPPIDQARLKQLHLHQGQRLPHPGRRWSPPPQKAQPKAGLPIKAVPLRSPAVLRSNPLDMRLPEVGEMLTSLYPRLCGRAEASGFHPSTEPVTQAMVEALPPEKRAAREDQIFFAQNGFDPDAGIGRTDNGEWAHADMVRLLAGYMGRQGQLIGAHVLQGHVLFMTSLPATVRAFSPWTTLDRLTALGRLAEVRIEVSGQANQAPRFQQVLLAAEPIRTNMVSWLVSGDLRSLLDWRPGLYTAGLTPEKRNKLVRVIETRQSNQQLHAHIIEERQKAPAGH